MNTKTHTRRRVDHYLELVKAFPLHSLRFLMREGGLKVADIGRLIGSASAASMILSGDREMSKSQIRVLAAHFKVDAGYFL